MTTLAEALGLLREDREIEVSITNERGKVSVRIWAKFGEEVKYVVVKSDVPVSAVRWAMRNADEIYGRGDCILKGAKALEFLGQASLLSRQCSARGYKIIV